MKRMEGFFGAYRVVISQAAVSIDNVELMASSLEFSNNFMFFDDKELSESLCNRSGTNESR